jgi:hypothetical protein
MKNKIENSSGKIFYGMHFYPGVAEYAEENKNPFRIFINENTIRKMDPTFAGRPVFVDHVDEVEESVDELRKEADGWVVESFFNAADGKHWVKFIVVTEKAERAIKNGFRLSNAYVPSGFGQGGLWNGVKYEKEVIGGEFEHLAIVKNPRYEESVIMSPEEFKNYFEQHEIELKRLANSKENENHKTKNEEFNTMKINFFKKQKVENSIDLESTLVLLPKSGKEKTLVQLVNEADEMALTSGYANEDDKVKIGEGEMSVKELVEKYNALCSEMEGMKKPKEDGEELENEDEESEVEESEDDAVENVEDDEAAKKKAMDLVEHEEKEILAKKQNAKEKKDKKHFDALKNAPKAPLAQRIELSEDQVTRGKSRYGSAH